MTEVNSGCAELVLLLLGIKRLLLQFGACWRLPLGRDPASAQVVLRTSRRAVFLNCCICVRVGAEPARSGRYRPERSGCATAEWGQLRRTRKLVCGDLALRRGEPSRFVPVVGAVTVDSKDGTPLNRVGLPLASTMGMPVLTRVAVPLSESCRQIHSLGKTAEGTMEECIARSLHVNLRIL